MLAVGAEGTDLFGAAMAAAIFVTPIGGFLSVVTRMPVTDEAFDTFGAEPEGENWISVSGPVDQQETARAVLLDLHPTKMSARGND